MGRRKQYLDEDMDSSEDEDGQISFDTMDHAQQDDDLMDGFIGFQRAGKQKRQKRFTEDMGDTDDDDDDNDAKPRGGIGSMAAAAAGTSSFLPAQKTFDPPKNQTLKASTTTASTPDRRSPARTTTTTAMNRGSSSPSPGPGFAAFTKHTTGFGQKMLEKMGWKAGKGLGAGGEGMINPVETKQRPKGMGMGFRGFEERTAQAKMDAAPLTDEDEDEGTTKPAALRQAWKKQPNTPRQPALPKKKKMAYQTATDILQAQQQQQQHQQQQKVIDMTGPSVREINLADIKRTDSPTLMETTSRLPELRHNLRLIVDLARGDLENLTREKQTTLGRWTELQESVVEIEQRQQTDDERLQKVANIRAIATELQQIARQANTTLATLSLSALFGDCFDRLQADYLDQVRVLGLDALVVSVWAPVMKYRSIHWDVLADPTWGIDDVKRWRPLLRSNDDDAATSKKHARRIQQQPLVATPFETMMNTIWLSKVRSAIK